MIIFRFGVSHQCHPIEQRHNQLTSTKPRIIRSAFGKVLYGLMAIGALVIFNTAPAYAQAALNFERCTVTLQAFEVDAECATFKRHENPSDTTSRLIGLSVVKLASYSPEPEADAFTMIQGGPGGSSIDLAVSHGVVFNEIRKKRDILVIDQRGTGRSNLLACDMPDEPVGTFDPVLARKLTKECVDKLSKNNDLRYFTTSIAVDDLEALREAAGYTQLNLYGVSYGTRVAQHYLRKYPQSTRSVVLDGVVPIGLNLAGGEIARRWEDSFTQLNARCQANSDCKAKHGDLREKYQALKQRFTDQHISISVRHPLTAESVDYTFTEDSLFVALRLMLYSTEHSALVPLLLSETDKGNYAFAATQIIQIEETLSNEFAIGMQNSVMCTEDAPFVSEREMAKADGTLVGRMMAEAMSVTCDAWPKGHLDDDFHQAFKSEVPVLVLSGETDPITPAANGDVAAKMLGNAKHIVVPSHGHGVISRGCMPKLVSNFIKDTNLDQIDASCIEREHSMPFFSTLTGPKS